MTLSISQSAAGRWRGEVGGSDGRSRRAVGVAEAEGRGADWSEALRRDSSRAAATAASAAAARPRQGQCTDVSVHAHFSIRVIRPFLEIFFCCCCFQAGGLHHPSHEDTYKMKSNLWPKGQGRQNRDGT